jgi:hypothetical protein
MTISGLSSSSARTIEVSPRGDLGFMRIHPLPLPGPSMIPIPGLSGAGGRFRNNSDGDFVVFYLKKISGKEL